MTIVITSKKYIQELLFYRATENGCYINIWIGLFFITPLINSMITGLKNINTNYKERDYQVSK